MDTSYLLFGVLLFVAVVLALEGLYLLWAARHSAEARRLAARLRYLEGTPAGEPAPDLIADGARRGQWLERTLLVRTPLGQRLVAYVHSAGTGRSAGELVLASALLGPIGALLGMMLEWPALQALLVFALLTALPWLWLVRRRTVRQRQLEVQLPLALDLIGRALRAGHALPSAMRMVGEEMSDPIAREFRQLASETSFGMAQTDALLRLAQRVQLEDLRYVVVAVLIQQETGGNLAELLDNCAALVRARLKLLGQIRTLSAEGRLSAWILGLLPFGTAALMHTINPGFMATLWTDPAGMRLLSFALAAMAVGVLWMRRVIRIRV